MKRIEGYSNRQVRLLDAMSLYYGKARNIDEIMDISGLTNKEKTLIHLHDLCNRGLITRYTAQSDDTEVYYLINGAGRIAFDELFTKYGEDVIDECMTQVEMEDRNGMDGLKRRCAND